MAELERNVIRERVIFGMECARQDGTKSGKGIGRSKRIFDRPEVVRLREAGLSIERIAGQMAPRCWDRSSCSAGVPESVDCLPKGLGIDPARGGGFKALRRFATSFHKHQVSEACRGLQDQRRSARPESLAADSPNPIVRTSSSQ